MSQIWNIKFPLVHKSEINGEAHSTAVVNTQQYRFQFVLLKKDQVIDWTKDYSCGENFSTQNANSWMEFFTST